MFRFSQIHFVRALCLVWLSWSCTAGAISLGSPKLLSRPGEPLKVEFPIRVGADEQSALSSLNVGIANKSAYDRLGISQKILSLNPQAMIYRNQQEQLMVLLETVESVPMTDDPFLDVLVTLNWSAGSLTKTYTLLLGDTQKILVKPGQTLSEIAAQLAPQLQGATLNQTMMALFKANPDAFASGSISRLEAGAELNRPNQALLRSISPAEAQQFVAESNAQWIAEREAKGGAQSASTLKKGEDTPAKDRLKIGSSAEGSSEERRYTEDLVAQEKALEQTRIRVAELEKNIADLQRLLDQAKGKSSEQAKQNGAFGLGGFAPAIFALGLMGLTGLLLWLLAKNARRSEVRNFSDAIPEAATTTKQPDLSQGVMPARAKALFAGIDLDLSPAKKSSKPPVAEVNPLADALRVKLNLARAYITIEDFAAAKKSLQEIVHIGGSIDPAITVEAQGLLAELSHRNS
ncbi:pilus assembly protein FimV [Polynucleobacter sp. 71A-WALBACH]|uniref:FimV/HubP family polar landmark protein n=1 Tax=Polynucleobacter sp. 71A-WALBACH TaxID=2689097 RepID=UPI001C0B7F9A|nr:FimV/HubP family polar landmark protein [Polynucleobacter sp. 71A-WALBACH]MBU3594433.1 pilus assembly protein FimV [Polynucleobacter sp. 71A-WALBACH]